MSPDLEKLQAVDSDLVHTLRELPPERWERVLKVASENNPEVAAILGRLDAESKPLEITQTETGNARRRV